MSGRRRGVFSRIFRRAEKRAITPFDFWGDNAEQALFGSESIKKALTLVPVYAATNLISSEIASLPLQTFRKVGDARRKIDNPELFDDPTQFGTIFEWTQRALTSLLLRGNAFGLITSFDNRGFPRRIEWLHPDDVSVLEDRSVSRPTFFWLGREIDPLSFVHIPAYVVPGTILGLSPIGLFANTIEAGLLAEKFGRDWFSHGMIPASVLSTDQRVDEDQARIIKERFIRNAKNREPAVLGAGMEYRPITVLPNESQFLQTIQAKTNDVAAIYNMPAERIGGNTGSSRTYANREQDAQDLVEFTFRPWIVKLENFFKRFVPEDDFVRFNINGLLRAELKTRYEAHSIALADGWRNRDEVRAIEELPPLPDGEGQSFAPQQGISEPDTGFRKMIESRQVTQSQLDDAERAISAFMESQRDAVLAGDDFDIERWNDELVPILQTIGVRASAASGRAAIASLGLESGDYDVQRTLQWLRVNSEAVAAGINSTTGDQIKAARDDEDNPDALPNVFAVAIGARAAQIARTHVTATSGFGSLEAVNQSGLEAMKTWRVTSSNPRSSHSRLNGVSVPSGEFFSNGARWPGDSRITSDERAGCSCELDITAA